MLVNRLVRDTIGLWWVDASCNPVDHYLSLLHRSLCAKICAAGSSISLVPASGNIKYPHEFIAKSLLCNMLSSN